MLAGYGGEFLADRNTLDLVRLELRTAQLDPRSGVCSASTTLDYRRVRLRDSEFLLPSSTLMRIVNSNGTQTENETVYSNCHEFLGESALTFDDPVATQGSAASVDPAGAPAIPPGLSFRAKFAQDLDTTTAAAGDAFSAKLTAALIDRSGHVIAPAGSLVSGRIRTVRHSFRPGGGWNVDLQFESIQDGAHKLPFTARLEKAFEYFAAEGWTRGQRNDVPGKVGRENARAQRGAGNGAMHFVFNNDALDFILRKGAETHWVTIAPGPK
jgi:hypothetical protein